MKIGFILFPLAILVLAFVMERGRSEAVPQRFTRVARDFLVDHPGMAMESRGSRELLYRPGRMLEPQAIPSFLGQAERLLALLRGEAGH